MKSESLILLITIFSLLLTGCQSIRSETLTQTQTNLPLNRTEISAPTQIDITATSSPLLRTVKISPTPSLENPIKITPTIEDQKKYIFILGLLENNNNCKLPCLWGITPGISTWDSIEPFLSSIADELKYGDATALEINHSQFILYPHYYTFNPNPYNENPDKKLAIMVATNPEGIVDLITTRPPLTSEKFQISQILSEYGAPEEILIESTIEYPPILVPWYWIVLLYPEKGFSALYEGEGEIKEGGVEACPKTTGPDLLLFSYEDMSIEALSSLSKYVFFSDVGIPGSIEDKPSLTITTFLTELLDPSGCVIIKPYDSN